MKERSKIKTEKYLHALEQHRATLTLLKQTDIMSGVQNSFPEESRVLYLFELLSSSDKPVTAKEVITKIEERDKETISVSAISQIRDELNTTLLHFSRKHNLLKLWKIIVEVPTKEPSDPRFGYYFACKKFKRKKYLDEDRIRSLLNDIRNEEITYILKQILSLQANESFTKNLYGRVEDYQPLDMQVIEIDERFQGSDTRLADYQSDESRKNAIWTWVRFNPKLLLDSKATFILSMETGGGKTTFLRYLQTEFFKDKRRIPLYIHASELEKWDYTCVNSFLNCLAIWIGPQIAEPKDILLQYLKETFEEKILLLVDGLDQISGVGTEYRQVLEGLLKVCSDNLIVASRPTAVEGQETNPDVKFLRLKSFSENSQKKFFGEYYERAYQLCERDLNLLAVPMLAYMVRKLIEEHEDKKIENRASLYKRFIDYILLHYEHERYKLSRNERLTVRNFLREISYCALQNSEPFVQRIPLEFCWEIAQKYRDLAIDILPKYGLVNLILDTSGGSNEYLYFTHQSFQEYLAAQALAEKEDCVEMALKYVYNPVWKQVLVMLAGVLNKPGLYVAALLRMNREDLLCRPLFLATQAAGEAGRYRLPKELFIGLADELRNIWRHQTLSFLSDLAIYAVRDLPELALDLVPLIKDASCYEYLLAGEVLREVGCDHAVPSLIQNLEDENASDRRGAAEALGHIGSEKAVTALIHTLQKEHGFIRLAAVRALGEIGSEQAVPALLQILLQTLQDEDYSLSSATACALRTIGSEKTVPALLQALQNDNKVTDLDTVRILYAVGSKQAVPALLLFLRGEDEFVRLQVVEALSKINSDQTVSALSQVLRDDEKKLVREEIARALGKIGSEQAIPTLLQTLQHDQDYGVRRQAAGALGKIGSGQVVPTLLQALQDESICKLASLALGEIGSKQAVPDLLQALNNQDSFVRTEAVIALAKIGSKQAIPALIRILQDEDSFVRQEATRALGKIGSEQTIPALLQVMQDWNYLVRCEVVTALGQIGSEQAVPTLLQILHDNNTFLLEDTIETLGKIGSDQAVPALLQIIKDENSSIRWSSIKALGEIGSDQAVPVLLQALQDEDDFMRQAAAEALGKIGSDQAAPALFHSLQDKEYRVTQTAMKALIKVGSERAIEFLVQALQHKDRFLQWEAAAALRVALTKANIPDIRHLVSEDTQHDLQSLATSLNHLAKLCDDNENLRR